MMTCWSWIRSATTTGRCRREFQPERHPLRDQFTLQQGNDFIDDVIDVKRNHLRARLVQKCAHAPDHVARAVPILDDPFHGATHIIQIGCFTTEKSKAGLAIGDDRGERLIDLMRNRRADLSQSGDAAGMREVGLRGVQCFLRPPRLRDVHQRADHFLLAGYVSHAMGADMQMPDLPIGHQQTMFEVEVLRALQHAFDAILHKRAIVGMAALHDEID